MAKEARIFLSPPHMSGREMEFINDAFEKNFIAPLGENVTGFERDIMAYTRARAACAASSGSAAIHLALRVLGIGAGDLVAASSFTFIGSVGAIGLVGGEPIFIDSDEASWNADPSLIEECFKRDRPKAFILTHLYGQCADLDAICDLCERYKVHLIEDAAESLGATHRDRHSGTIGEIGIFSFNGNKIITTSGGGMLVSGDENRAENLMKRALFFATQARENRPYYEHFEIGYNYRMSNIAAGIGRGQMTALAERVKRRREIFDFYVQNLRDLPIAFMPEIANSCGNRWLTAITIEDRDFEPEDLRLALEGENIEARWLWKPMHLQKVFEGARRYERGVSERLFKRGLCLPSGTAMSAGDLERVVRGARKFFNGRI